MLRLSKNFLLLDFLYDQSTMDCVVHCGKQLSREVDSKLVEGSEVVMEGRYLCKAILDRIVEKHGPVSISAGLWFQDLPNRPWHVRVSKYFVLLDFCRNEKVFERGMVTVPPLTFRAANTVIKVARMFGEVLDPVKKHLGNISVVRGRASVPVSQMAVPAPMFAGFVRRAMT